MKKPLFNLEQREEMRSETLGGAFFELSLAFQHARRSIYKEKGWFAMKRAERLMCKVITFKMNEIK